jgi:hypothetical protein
MFLIPMTFGLSETIKQNFAPKIVKDFYFLVFIWKNIFGTHVCGTDNPSEDP